MARSCRELSRTIERGHPWTVGVRRHVRVAAVVTAGKDGSAGRFDVEATWSVGGYGDLLPLIARLLSPHLIIF